MELKPWYRVYGLGLTGLLIAPIMELKLIPKQYRSTFFISLNRTNNGIETPNKRHAVCFFHRLLIAPIMELKQFTSESAIQVDAGS